MAAGQLSGVLPVMKERGYTSNDVVSRLRRILHMKKIGHTGTLDPEATGVLPVCLGRATKIAGYLTDTDKTYRCVMRLGITTDTEDMTGSVTGISDTSGMDDEKIRQALLSFIGEYDQIPPMYSAKKVGGKKLYELAREGITIERKPARVRIESITDISTDISEDGMLTTFTVECSKGTYIRSLCRDAGEKLGCGASMQSLVRTRACGISIDDCMTLDEIEKLAHDPLWQGSSVIPAEHFFMDLADITVSGTDEKFVKNGNKLKVRGLARGRYRVYLSDGTFAALYDVDGEEARLCRLFLE
ncbi:MAG: tRNA pseudouridine(55) synthase TruB [Lachnospiraceae bacterium]|nr:tRNA pseudouridine(55) synthase TruB [Lachnospiraceae bacterium]